MINYQDAINQTPVWETRTCEYHKKNPGKQFAGCCCSTLFGYRLATPSERVANIKGAMEAIQKQIEELQAELGRLGRLLGEL